MNPLPSALRRSPRLRLLSLAAVAATALGALTAVAAPALADQTAAPAEKAPTIATPVADLVAQGMAAKDPNADGYDKFIVTYKGFDGSK